MRSFHSLAFSVSLRGAVAGAVFATLIGGGLAGCEREVSYPPGLSWGDPALPTYTSQQRLAVSCNGDDTLGFVSEDAPDRPQLLGAAAVGSSPVEIEGPHHLTSSSDGKFIFFNLSNYVINGGSGPHGAHGTGTVPGYLVKLDARTGRPLARVLVDRSPGDVIRSADDRLIFVSHYDLARLGDALTRGLPREQGYSSVAIIDAASMELLSMTPVCPTAHGMGLSPDGKLLYVTCSLSDELAVLNVELNEILGSAGQMQIVLDADLRVCRFSPSATRLYALDQSDIGEALNAASQIGDDTLQRNATGAVRPESFTHGSSAQRVSWFKRGLESGQVNQCNTFDSRS